MFSQHARWDATNILYRLCASLLVSRFARCNVSFITNQTTLDASVVTKHHHHRSILVDSNLIRRAALVHVTRSDHPRRKKLRATETRFVSRILFFLNRFSSSSCIRRRRAYSSSSQSQSMHTGDSNRLGFINLRDDRRTRRAKVDSRAPALSSRARWMHKKKHNKTNRLR